MSRRLPTLGLLLAATLGAAEEAPVRDPMRPFGGEGGVGGVAAAARPRFVLTAVLISSERRVAIVNGTPYVQGAVVDGAEIVAIEQGRVRLRENGAEHTISLGRRGAGRRSVTQGGGSP